MFIMITMVRDRIHHKTVMTESGIERADDRLGDLPRSVQPAQQTQSLWNDLNERPRGIQEEKRTLQYALQLILSGTCRRVSISPSVGGM
jgi:hypothetical protein